MYMKRIFHIHVILSALLFAACGSDEPLKHVVFADSPVMFNWISPADGSRAVPTVVDGVTYHIVFDDDKRNATITLDNFRLSPEAPSEIATFTNVEWTYESGSHEKRRIISSDILVSDGAPGASVTLTDVVIIYTESNDLSPEPSAGFYASYIVDGAYSVLSFPYKVYCFGTTTINPADSIAPNYVDYLPEYTVTLRPGTMQADMTVSHLEVGGMTFDMTITGLLLTLTPEGYDLKSNAATAVRVSASGVAITDIDLTAGAELRDRLVMTMNFKVNGTPWMLQAYLSPDLNELDRKR